MDGEGAAPPMRPMIAASGSAAACTGQGDAAHASQQSFSPVLLGSTLAHTVHVFACGMQLLQTGGWAPPSDVVMQWADGPRDTYKKGLLCFWGTKRGGLPFGCGMQSVPKRPCTATHPISHPSASAPARPSLRTAGVKSPLSRAASRGSLWPGCYSSWLQPATASSSPPWCQRFIKLTRQPLGNTLHCNALPVCIEKSRPRVLHHHPGNTCILMQAPWPTPSKQL